MEKEKQLGTPGAAQDRGAAQAQELQWDMEKASSLISASNPPFSSFRAKQPELPLTSTPQTQSRGTW